MVNGIGGFSPSFGSLNKAQDLLLRSSQRLGSGKRINSAADDAANLAISERLSALERSVQQGERNLADGQGMVRVAEGALSSSADLVGRMRELAVQAGNGTLSDADRATIQEEYDQLAAEVDRISQSTEFNGSKLLDGSMSGAGAVELNDGRKTDQISVEIGDAGASSLGLSGIDISDPNSLDAIDGALDRISSQRASLGAVDKQLSTQIENLRTVNEATAAARSRISDTDYAAEVSKRTKADILGQAQIALLASGRPQAQSVLRLLS